MDRRLARGGTCDVVLCRLTAAVDAAGLTTGHSRFKPRSPGCINTRPTSPVPQGAGSSYTNPPDPLAEPFTRDRMLLSRAGLMEALLQ